MERRPLADSPGPVSSSWTNVRFRWLRGEGFAFDSSTDFYAGRERPLAQAVTLSSSMSASATVVAWLRITNWVRPEGLDPQIVMRG